MMHALAIEDGMETIRKAIDAARATFGFDQFVITGYCMGGTFALRAACEIPELKAAAAFYGDIPEDSVLKNLSVPTLFIAGNRDSWITPEKVARLRKAASEFGLPIETISYDADHAFFNDTRPEVYKGMAVPEVLLSGHHKEIARWRLKQSLGRTWLRRPDLLQARELTREERELLDDFIGERSKLSKGAVPHIAIADKFVRR